MVQSGGNDDGTGEDSEGENVKTLIDEVWYGMEVK